MAKHKTRVPSLGFRFSQRDNERIAKACSGAADFMKRYGRGRKTSWINKQHYFLGTHGDD